jgi:1-acyl-sn-glycerol-3-phosphate acyltransferase
VSRYWPEPEPWTRVAIPLVRGIARVTSRPDYRGRAAFPNGSPQPGGLLLAANHLSNLDPVLLARFVLERGRIPRFLAKHQLFDAPVVGAVLKGARQIPVFRYQENAADALAAAVDALRAGELVVIYPEGTFTTDPQGWPMLARTGVARLALQANVPVVPVAQWRAGRRHSVLVGPALDMRPWQEVRTTPSAEALHSVTSAVMGRIREQLAELRGEPPPTRVWDPRQRARRSESFVQ